MKDFDTKQRYSSYLCSRRKRWFDVGLCLVLVVPAVIIIAVAALFIFFEQGRPVFFIHERTGKEGRVFRMPKLRTLPVYTNPYIPSTISIRHYRLTATGRFLRRHRLDELPQLFCVLKGDMSLVGPRPELPNIVAGYKPFHKYRLVAKPGITGLWQLMGNRNVGMHDDMVYDLYYLHNASLWLDLKILFLTIGFMLYPEGRQHR